MYSFQLFSLRRVVVSFLILALGGVFLYVASSGSPQPVSAAPTACDYSVGDVGSKWGLQAITVDGVFYDMDTTTIGRVVTFSNWPDFESWFASQFPDAHLSASFNPDGIETITITGSTYQFDSVTSTDGSIGSSNFTQSNCGGTSGGSGTCTSGSGDVSGIASVDGAGVYSPEYSTHADIDGSGEVVSYLRTNSSELWLYRKSTGLGTLIGQVTQAVPSISSDGHYITYNNLAGDTVIRDLNTNTEVKNLGPGHDFLQLSEHADYISFTDYGVVKMIRLSDMTELDFGAGQSVHMSPNGQYITFQDSGNNLVNACTIASDFTYTCHLNETGAMNPVIANNGDMAFQKNGELIFYRRSDDSYHIITADGSNQNISADGRFVVFFTGLQLAPTDTNGFGDVYVYDTTTAEIKHISLHNGIQSDDQIGDKSRIAISDDGAFIAMHGHSSNWFGNTDSNAQVFYFANPLVCTPPVDPTPVCGDGVRAASEQCDDGNTDDKDSCTNACEISGLDVLESCGWNPHQYDTAKPLSDLGTIGSWYNFNNDAWTYPLPLGLGVPDVTPKTTAEQASLGYYDDTATGTASRITVTLGYDGTDGNASDFENLNAFLMDSSGNIIDTYYTPVTSSLGGLTAVSPSFQYLKVDDKNDEKQTFTFSLLLPTPQPTSNLVVGIGFDDADGGTQDATYSIQDIQIEGTSCITPPPVCGNSAIEVGEYCDDGNTDDGDGCSMACVTEYQVSYNPNGGTGTMGNQLFVYDASQNLSSNVFTRTGYAFSTWNTMSNGSGTMYANNQSVVNLTGAPSISLYAQWTPNIYTLTYSGGLSDGGTSPATQTGVYSSTLTLAPNTFTRTGYSPDGWDCGSIGSGYVLTGNTLCTARWIIDTYTVRFLDYDATVLNTQSVTYGGIATPPSSPTRTGYTFAGWSGAMVTDPIVNNTEFIALYTTNQYTLTFDSASGTAVAPITQGYNTSIIAPTAPTRTGYAFAGWSPVLPTTMPAYNTTYTATWTDSAPPTITLSGSSTITLVKNASYTDAGATCTDNVDATCTVTSSGTVNTAVPGTYTITYTAIDASGNTSTTTRTVTVVLGDIPVITLLGSTPISIEAGSIYTDAGATALDTEDGNITASIVTSSTVNTGIVGTYTVTYNVTDSSSNTGATVTRTVTVVDTTPPLTPTILTPGSGSILKDNTPTFSGTGEVGTTVTLVVDGQTLTGTVDASGNWNITPTTPLSDGLHTVTVTLTDTSGNMSPASSRIFTVDTTPPVLALIGSGTISLPFGGVYTELGARWTDAIDGSGTLLTATSGSVNPNIAGTYTLTYRYTDTVGNTATITRTVTIGQPIGSGGGGGTGGTPVVPITPTTPTVPVSTQTGTTPPLTQVPTPPTPSTVSLLPTQSLATPAGTNKSNEHIYTIENRITDYICPQIVQVYSEDELKAQDISASSLFSDDIKSVIMFRGLEKDEQMNGQTFEEYKKFGIAINDTSFEPTRNVTRAEYVKMLVRALSCRYQKEGVTTPFSDVDENMWYAEYINFATNHGWINGYQDGTFRPDAPITRAEAAKILANAIQLEKGDNSSSFSDVPDNSVFTPYIEALKDNKIISGRTSTTYAPDAYIPRTEVSRIIYKTFLGGEGNSDI